MVSWMCNNAKDVKTAIDNTLRVSLAFLVKLENNNAMAQRTKVPGCISLGFSIVPFILSATCGKNSVFSVAIICTPDLK